MPKLMKVKVTRTSYTWGFRPELSMLSQCWVSIDNNSETLLSLIRYQIIFLN